ncbi:MAG: hydrogenase maturation protease [Asgard group archaeon]|nr:hydrogenase maturation protease [Asgard group archaeon]
MTIQPRSITDVSSLPKTLVIGIGNPILRDDGIGNHIVNLLSSKYSNLPHTEFLELSTGGLSLAEKFVGYEKVIIIDAVALENAKVGEVFRFGMADMKHMIHQYSAHDYNLATAYHILKTELDSKKLPKDVIIFGIQIEPSMYFGEGLSDRVTRAIPKVLNKIKKELLTPAHLQEDKEKIKN